MKSRWIALLAGCMAAVAAHSEDATVTLGKQRAAASQLEWEVKDAAHPSLGQVRFAYIKKLVATPVGNANVFSRAYVSCQRGTRRIAIELTNTTSPDDSGGLRPKATPNLACNRLAAPGDTTTIREDLLAPRWQVNEIGDALARGLTTFSLRECAWIDVVQEVELPGGWARSSTPVTFEITPYNRELDSIFAACGEVSAYAPAAAPSKPAPKPDKSWQPARVVASGTTNVRAGPTLQSAIVTQLHPGTPVQVRRADGEWWRARWWRSGKPIEGYIREDRLVFK